jgi:hypothetical protein
VPKESASSRGRRPPRASLLPPHPTPPTPTAISTRLRLARTSAREPLSTSADSRCRPRARNPRLSLCLGRRAAGLCSPPPSKLLITGRREWDFLARAEETAASPGASPGTSPELAGPRAIVPLSRATSPVLAKCKGARRFVRCAHCPGRGCFFLLCSLSLSLSALLFMVEGARE